MRLKMITCVMLAICMAGILGGCGLSHPDTSASADTATQVSEIDTMTVSDWEGIQKRGSLTIGITIFRPMNYYDKEEKLVGFDTELAQIVCERLGLKPEFKVISWDTIGTELESENIDCVWNGMGITEERKDNMSVTDPYLKFFPALVMKKEKKAQILENIAQAKVTSEAGSSSEGMIDGSVFQNKDAEVSAYELFYHSRYTSSISLYEAILAVEEETADIAFVDYSAARAIKKESPDFNDLVIYKGFDFGSVDSGVGFRKGSDAMTIINSEISKCYEDGTMAVLAKKYGLSPMLIH